MLVSEAARRRLSEFAGSENAVDSEFFLPAELLPQHQVSNQVDALPETAWRSRHDVELEVYVTPRTLLRLRQYHGSLVQVSNSSQRGKYHLARLIAVPSAGCRDGTAYLKPLLAFNLGLHLHLQPFLAGVSADSEQVVRQQRMQSHSTSSTSNADSSDSPTIFASIVVKPAQRSEAAATRDLPQPGCQPAVVGVAKSISLARIQQPILKLFGHEDEESGQAEGATGLQSSGQEGGSSEQVDRSVSDMESSLEELVNGLQSHFRRAIRLTCVGDIVSVPVADSSGRTQILAGMYSSSPAQEHVYLRVTAIRPSGAGALIIDPDTTRVALQGSCNGFLIPRLPQSSVGSQVDSADDSSLWRALAAIIAPALHPVSREVELRASVLLKGPAGSGKSSAVATAARALGIHLTPFSCQELRGPSDAKTAAALEAVFETAQGFAPCLLLLTDLAALAEGSAPGGGEVGTTRTAAVLEDCISKAAAGKSRVITVATAAAAGDVPPPLRRCFAHELFAEAPGMSQRAAELQQLLPQLPHSVTDAMAPKTAGLLPGDLRALSADAAAQAIASGVDLDGILQLKTGKAESADKSLPEVTVTEAHLEAALEGVRKRTATALGAPQVPDVRWEDVGGLEDVKQAVLETVELPLKHPELFSGGLRRRSGLLLYGPPGTGKTLVAKAVATECALNFLSVKGPELINMYIGESERQVREVFEKARRARPCVLFFDELDSLAPARGAGADSAGVMDRVVSQLLAEVDGLQGGSNNGASPSQDVFLIGATNRPDLLDPALMRPGRLDKLLYVGVAEKAEDKLKVLQALTRKFRLASSVRLPHIAAACGPTLTGADLYALCADAWMGGLRRVMAALEDGAEAEEVEVEHNDFEAALAELTPSLSQEELARYLALRQQYRGL